MAQQTKTEKHPSNKNLQVSEFRGQEHHTHSRYNGYTTGSNKQINLFKNFGIN